MSTPYQRITADENAMAAVMTIALIESGRLAFDQRDSTEPLMTTLLLNQNEDMVIATPADGTAPETELRPDLTWLEENPGTKLVRRDVEALIDRLEAERLDHPVELSITGIHLVLGWIGLHLRVGGSMVHAIYCPEEERALQDGKTPDEQEMDHPPAQQHWDELVERARGYHPISDEDLKLLVRCRAAMRAEIELQMRRNMARDAQMLAEDEMEIGVSQMPGQGLDHPNMPEPLRKAIEAMIDTLKVEVAKENAEKPDRDKED